MKTEATNIGKTLRKTHRIDRSNQHTAMMKWFYVAVWLVIIAIMVVHWI